MLVADRLSESTFFAALSKYYYLAPSAVLIRTAEAELLHALPMEPPVLDLCCGDGFFANLIHPVGFAAGCDKDKAALRKAGQRGTYKAVVCADVATGIPFSDGSFQTVFSNSSLEHVKDIDKALQEIARVLRPGGRFYTTFGSHYAYEWWPCGGDSRNRYLEFQPVHNYFPLSDWKQHMSNAGIKVIQHHYYLSKKATKELLFFDYHFSHVYNTSDRTPARSVLWMMKLLPASVLAWFWRKFFANVKILSGEEGGGILIVAESIEKFG